MKITYRYFDCKKEAKKSFLKSILQNKPLGAPQGGACGSLWAPAACSRNQLYNYEEVQYVRTKISVSVFTRTIFRWELKCESAGGGLVYDFLLKIYLYIESRNVVIHCTTGQSASNIGILENVLCLVN